jgi:hypothetical protein
LPFLHFFWCITQRSPHVVTKVYYMSMSWVATDSQTNGPRLQCKGFLHKCPLLHHVVQVIHKVFSQSMMSFPHSTKQDTQHIAFLISKQSSPYQTCGGTSCPRVSTSKIRSLAYSSTTCHADINHLHNSNRCSNHNIDPHTVTSHLDGWKT